MKITAVTTYPIDVPIRQEVMLTTSLGSHTQTHVTLVKMETDAEHHGAGEATVSPAWSGESVLGSQYLIDQYLAPPLIGLEIIPGPETDDVEEALRRMDRASQLNPFAKATLEMAIWDLKGKAANAPVYELLGGAVRDVAMPIRFSLAALSPEDTAANAARRVEWGHTTVKVKVGGDVEGDIARMRAVRDAIGPDILLTCDANGGWIVRDAILALNQMDDLEITLAEQPTPREDLDALAAVTCAVSMPVMADEGVFTLFDADQCLRKQAADIIAVYPGKNGGILRCKQIVELAAKYDVPCAIGSNLELDLGTSPMCQISVACENLAATTYHGDILGPLYHEVSIAKNPIEFEGGLVHAPTGPGLGVEVDWDLVERLRYSP